MSGRIGIGKSGMGVAACLAFAMCFANFLIYPVSFTPLQTGICFPSPDSWVILPVISWILNWGIIVLTTFLLYLINKNYNFVRTTEPALFAIFIIATSSMPWFSESLNASTLICLANTLAMGIMFGNYDSHNATQSLFVVGVIAGTGSMIQYAFFLMAFAYLIWAIFLKILRLKEFLAFLAGIICPYWIVLGLGIAPFENLHIPSISPFFISEIDYSSIIFLVLAVGIAIFIGLICTLVNSMKLYAGNSRVNGMNLCITALGVISLIGIFLDFQNMQSYIVSLFMAMAVQVANLCALWDIEQEWLVSVIPSSAFIAIFFCIIFL